MKMAMFFSGVFWVLALLSFFALCSGALHQIILLILCVLVAVVLRTDAKKKQPEGK